MRETRALHEFSLGSVRTCRLPVWVGVDLGRQAGDRGAAPSTTHLGLSVYPEWVGDGHGQVCHHLAELMITMMIMMMAVLALCAGWYIILNGYMPLRAAKVIAVDVTIM